jgi:hypothetical protein
MKLLIPSDQLRHRFRTVLSSAIITCSLSATQEARSHVAFQAFGLEAFMKFEMIYSCLPPFLDT